jgi:hypothetical protein
VVDQLPVGDPQLAVYGPSVFTLANATTASNPLATRMRFVGANRGDGQVQAPAIKTLGLTVGKTVRLSGTREVELAGNLFNLLDAGNYTQYNDSGANEPFNPNFLQLRNQQPGRGDSRRPRCSAPDDDSCQWPVASSKAPHFHFQPGLP